MLIGLVGAGRRLPPVHPLRADAVMNIANAAGFPILSLLTFLPLLGCAVLIGLLLRGGDEARRWPPTRAGPRSGPPWCTFFLSLLLWVRFRHAAKVRLPVPGISSALAAGMPSVRHYLRHGRGRHLGAVRAAVDRTDADLHPGEHGKSIHTRVREYMVAFLVLETHDGGHVRRTATSLVFYVFFEGVLIPMYHHHRRLGRPAACLCRR